MSLVASQSRVQARHGGVLEEVSWDSNPEVLGQLEKAIRRIKKEGDVFFDTLSLLDNRLHVAIGGRDLFGQRGSLACLGPAPTRRH